MMVLSEYTGGVRKWGTLLYRCTNCGEIVAEYNCNENGIPIEAIFDEMNTHECEED